MVNIVSMIPKVHRIYIITRDSSKKLSVFIRVQVYVSLGHEENVFGIPYEKFLEMGCLLNAYYDSRS